jgi:hypothetical protein
MEPVDEEISNRGIVFRDMGERLLRQAKPRR